MYICKYVTVCNVFMYVCMYVCVCVCPSAGRSVGWSVCLVVCPSASACLLAVFLGQKVYAYTCTFCMYVL